MKKFLKFGLATAITVAIGWLTNVASRAALAAWTNASIEMARHNMGDLNQYRNIMDLWGIARFATWIIGIGLILGIWYLLYNKTLKGLQ